MTRSRTCGGGRSRRRPRRPSCGWARTRRRRPAPRLDHARPVIGAAPDRTLGADCAARFGGRLPFLLKVLSAAKALSIQVHPSRAQAEAGYAAENARGLAPGDPARNYVDDWPKPELLYALTPFEVAAGLRTSVRRRGAPARVVRRLAAAAGSPAFCRHRRARHGGLARVGPRLARARPARERRRGGLQAARGLQAAPTRTPAPRRSGSPPTTRATSAWSRSC